MELEEQLKSIDFLKQLAYLTDIATYLKNLNLNNFQVAFCLLKDLFICSRFYPHFIN